MNHHCPWLFPRNPLRTTHLRIITHASATRPGIDIQAARNGALHDLTKEIDPASLADLLGYSTKVMNIHAARAALPMATYSALRQPIR